MEMSDPAPCNPLDDNRQGLIGKPIERVDGKLKVTGKAAYAYEVRERHPAAYGFIVEATIATGVVSDIDTRSASLWRAFRRSRRQQIHRRNPSTPHAGRIRGGPHTE